MRLQLFQHLPILRLPYAGRGGRGVRGGEQGEGHCLEWGCLRAGGSWKHGGVEDALSYSLAALTTLVDNILETSY